MRGFIFYTFLICCITIDITKAAPTAAPPLQLDGNSSEPENTFLKSIQEKCHEVALDESITKFTNPLLQKCVNWSQINNTTVLDKTTEQDVLCLLYHDSFTSYCDEMKKYPNSKIDTSNFDEIIKTYTTKMICDNGIIPVGKRYEHKLLDLIKQKETCYKLCGTYEDTPVYECALANYLATFDFETLINKQNTQAQETSNVSTIKKESNTEPVNAGNSEKNSNNEVQKEVEADKHQQPNPIFNAQNNNGVPDNTLGNEKSVQNPSNVPSLVHKGKLNQVTTQEHPNDVHVPEKLAESQANQIPVQKADTKETQGNVRGDVNQDQSQHGIEPQENKQTDNKHNDNSPANHKKETISQGNQNTQHTEIHNSQINENLEKIQNQDASIGHFDKPDGNKVEKTKEKTVKDDGKLTNTQEDSPLKKQSTAANEEDVDTKVDDEALEVNQFQETDAEESMDPEFEARPDLPLVDEKPQQNLDDTPMVSTDNVYEIDGDSYFFSYFMVICVMFILGYVGYHNRLKVMALVLEGKRNKRQYRGRRPNSANYHKLDSNLEEAISSNVTKNSSNVIY